MTWGEQDLNGLGIIRIVEVAERAQKKEAHHKVRYIEYQSVYVPSSELGLSQPLSPASVQCSFPQKGGGHTRLRVRGWGSPNIDDWRKSLALWLLCEAKSSAVCGRTVFSGGGGGGGKK
jgi:hypothetical protein